MTAIGIVGTASGFIIGADGRVRLDEQTRAAASPELLEKETDDAQKIFEIKDKDRTLAYAITGSVGDPAGFDFVKTMRDNIAALTSRQFDDCEKYLRILSGKVNRVMNEAKQDGTLREFPQVHQVEQSTAWKIVDVFFGGYFKGFPCLSVVHFFHFHQSSQFRVRQYPYQFSWISGSDVVRASMYDQQGCPVENSPFMEYVKKLPANPTLTDAKEYIKGYIEACKSPLALQMDEAICKGIGGHVHIAEVTLDGFKWHIPPRLRDVHLSDN